MSSKKPKSKNTNSAKHLLTSDSQAPVTSHVPLIAQETIIGDLRGDKDEGFHRFFDCVDKLEPNRKFAYTTPNELAMRISRLPQNANEYGVIYRVWIGPTISIDVRLVISLTLAENPLHFQALLTHFNSKVTIAGQKISSAKYGGITLCLHRGLNPCIDALISEEQAN
jgi:hypothetical protein